MTHQQVLYNIYLSPTRYCIENVGHSFQIFVCIISLGHRNSRRIDAKHLDSLSSTPSVDFLYIILTDSEFRAMQQMNSEVRKSAPCPSFPNDPETRTIQLAPYSCRADISVEHRQSKELWPFRPAFFLLPKKSGRDESWLVYFCHLPDFFARRKNAVAGHSGRRSQHQQTELLTTVPKFWTVPNFTKRKVLNR
jgi:hypothetical protein